MHVRSTSIPIMEHAGESQSERDGDGSLASPQTAYHNASPVGGPSAGTPRASAPAPSLPLHARLDGHPVAPNVLAAVAKHRWYQTWHALRWKLTRDVFGKPLPLLTAHLDLKLGDLLVTLPVAVALLAVGAVELADLQTKNIGGPAQIALGLTFALAVRNNSLLLALTGLSFERAIFYHKFFGGVAFATASMHALSYVLKHHKVYGGASASTRPFTSDDYDDASASAAWTGAIAYFPLAALFLLSFYVIRRRCFEFFWRMHWLLFVAVLVGAVLHGITLAIVAGALWGVDAFYRLVYLQRVYAHGAFVQRKPAAAIAAAGGDSLESVAPPPPRKLGVVAASQVTATQVASDVVRIQFPRIRADTGERFDYEAGQYMFVCVPSLALLEWHPFSISSAPHEPFVTMHIKAVGDWTRKLLKQVAATPPDTPLEILLDGPYGSVSLDIASPSSTYSHVVLFSGGIGITPMRSVVNQLHYEYRHEGRTSLQRVRFVWSVRDRAMLQALFSRDAVERKQQQQYSVVAAPYLPNALLTTAGNDEERGVFFSEFFLTKGKRETENLIDQELQHCLRYNTRPDIRVTLKSVGDDAKRCGKTRVAVLVCGPSEMVKQVVSSAIALSSEMGIRFDVHSECFDF